MDLNTWGPDMSLKEDGSVSHEGGSDYPQSWANTDEEMWIWTWVDRVYFEFWF